MQEFSSFNGYAVKDAEARNRISSLESETSDRISSLESETSDRISSLESVTSDRISSLEIPSLPEEKKLALKSISSAYFTKRNSFTYAYSPNRNMYADGTQTFTEDGKVRINCSTFAQLVWAGISPDTFNDASTYDGTIVKSIDWGYWFQFFNRRVCGKTISGELIQFKKPKEDTYEGSYSWNTYYDEGSDREDGQVFKSYMDACDMAQELYQMGCEIPLSEVQMGDLIFFKANHLNDGITDGFQEMAFRNIGHVAFVHNVTNENGRVMLNLVHSMPFLSSGVPLTNTYAGNTGTWDSVYYAVLENTICMVARHPSAFGITNPVGDTFTAI